MACRLRYVTGERSSRANATAFVPDVECLPFAEAGRLLGTNPFLPHSELLPSFS